MRHSAATRPPTKTHSTAELSEQGLRTSGNRRDYVLDLDSLWRLAWGWYNGRVERGDSRREPAGREYLRAAGPSGEFWSLD